MVALSEQATLGLPRLHLRQTDSTNTRARELALAGAPHGTLVTAEEQTAGRGRQGRSWWAPARSALLMSLLLRWDAEDRMPELLPLVAAVAVCDVAGQGALVKWPNDVVRRDGDSLAKLAGILVEGRPQDRWAVLGIGVNVTPAAAELPPELDGRATSLGRGPEAVEPTLTALLRALEARLAERPAQALTAWRERDVLRGKGVVWSVGDQTAEGVAEGVDEVGRLLVRMTDGGLATLDSGEVHLA